MDPISIHYVFSVPEKADVNIDLQIDRETVSLLTNDDREAPDWTRLDYHKCAHCPLDSAEHPHCPVARNLDVLVTQFEGVISYEKLEVKCITNERTVFQQTTAQQAIGSVMGVIMATSGCPYTTFLKPLARFHLPFARPEETIYRVTSMYMLGQYFRRRNDMTADDAMSHLKDFYGDLGRVNRHMAERLRSVTRTDSTVNSLIVLNVYAEILPFSIEDSLEDIEYLFRDYLD